MNGSPQPFVLGHRGASGHRLENSLESFRYAMALGADGVELDVHATRDGALIVHHDPALSGVGSIAGLTLEEVRAGSLPNGEPIPLLEEALAAVPGAVVWIELKSLPPEADSALLSTIAAAGAPERCAVHSFDHRIIARLGMKAPSLRRGVLSVSYPIDPVGTMERAGANTLWQEWHLIDAELIAEVHRKGGQVIAWTVNDRQTALELASLGVDGLCGNYPERLRFR